MKLQLNELKELHQDRYADNISDEFIDIPKIFSPVTQKASSKSNTAIDNGKHQSPYKKGDQNGKYD